MSVAFPLLGVGLQLAALAGTEAAGTQPRPTGFVAGGGGGGGDGAAAVAKPKTPAKDVMGNPRQLAKNIRLRRIGQAGMLVSASYLASLAAAGSAPAAGANVANVGILEARGVLTRANYVSCALAVVGGAGRWWCFRTLDDYFTYNLQVQPGQKLVKHGPYRYVRHPSYTFLVLSLWGLWSVGHGPLSFAWDWLPDSPLVDVGALLPAQQGAADAGLPAATLYDAARWLASNATPRGLARLASTAWAASNYARYLRWFLFDRIPTEEAMLDEAFGDEWKEYAARTWKLLPFVW